MRVISQYDMPYGVQIATKEVTKIRGYGHPHDQKPWPPFWVEWKTPCEQP